MEGVAQREVEHLEMAALVLIKAGEARIKLAAPYRVEVNPSVEMACGVAYLQIKLTLAQWHVKADGRLVERAVMAEMWFHREGIAVVNLREWRPVPVQEVVLHSGEDRHEGCILEVTCAKGDVANASSDASTPVVAQPIRPRDVKLRKHHHSDLRREGHNPILPTHQSVPLPCRTTSVQRRPITLLFSFSQL